MYDQATSQKVTLDFFQAKPKVDVFATFGDQMAVGAEVAFKQLGITPAQGPPDHRLRRQQRVSRESSRASGSPRSGCTRRVRWQVALKYVIDAINGKKAPNPIDVMKTPGHPLIVDKAYLKKNPGFKADWGLSG